MVNFELSNGIGEMLLTEKRNRDHKRMWAAVNMREFQGRFGWTDEECNELADMLGLTEEMKWVKP